jgi:hypothetical protein
VGKGTHRALDRCQHFARRFRYVLQCDLVHFFPSIDHAILHPILARGGGPRLAPHPSAPARSQMPPRRRRSAVRRRR